MNDVPDAPLLSTTQLGELALDAALEADDVINRRSDQLNLVRRLLLAIRNTLATGDGGVNPARIDLTYLPIYESALGIAANGRPERVVEFAERVKMIFQTFLMRTWIEIAIFCRRYETFVSLFMMRRYLSA